MPLMGFDGNVTMLGGTIWLYFFCRKSYYNYYFVVLNTHTSYNAIFERLWIHKLRTILLPTLTYQISYGGWGKRNKRKIREGKTLLQLCHKECITFLVEIATKGWAMLESRYYTLGENLSDDSSFWGLWNIPIRDLKEEKSLKISWKLVKCQSH